ncbi:uncharacterized protein LOC111711119 [Eurytemora carolleeae]|uniref:uncharacterized protein LOC111711119 n=1 Tax=Eurytemora carolleeae TaxID=1294199 RepID=UPI000C76521E|nr:uncharacterized protein LOC111711119 [Eurytemora carolleeae]|eukprot:XP_023341143.1 uncharacterized protein LOC111711119 [Eurytemora affinis]
MGGEGYGALEEEFADENINYIPVKAPKNIRLEWAVSLLFGSYEITVSYLLVIISMAYYNKQEVPEVGEEGVEDVKNLPLLTNLCGSLLPDWKSVAVLFAFYTLIYTGLICLNVVFIRSTLRLRGNTLSTWETLLHPFSRLILGLISFFLICGFSETSPELQPVNKISYHLCQGSMTIDAAFFLFFLYISIW